MICYLIPSQFKNGLQLFGISLSKSELRNVSEGIPIRVDGNGYGLGLNLCIHHADSTEDIERQLIGCGIVEKKESEGG